MKSAEILLIRSKQFISCATPARDPGANTNSAIKMTSISKKNDLIKAFLDSDEATRHSRYCGNIDAVRRGLGRDNVKILIFDDIKTNPEGFLESIENFLGIKTKHYLDHKNLHKKINQTATNTPPESFQHLCRDITNRELCGLSSRNIRVPDHWTYNA